MSEREAMTLKLVAYHNEQARGASFEWHARCATHVENQEQIIKALADALMEVPHSDLGDGPCWCYPMEPRKGRHLPDCETRRAALSLAGRM